MKKITLIFISLISLSIQATDKAKTTNPTLFGVYRARYQVSADTGDQMFSMANVRVGLKGGVSEYLDYFTQVELASGRLQLLDVNATLKPTSWLKLTLGQQVVQIFNLYAVSHKEILFSDLLFQARYLVPPRDLGLTADFLIKSEGFPISAQIGVYNGGVINNPKWNKKISHSGRLVFGSMEGFRTTAKYYRYSPDEISDYLVLGADFRYENEDFKVETEIMNRYNYFDNNNFYTAYLQGAYMLPLDHDIFKKFIPALRWENMHNTLTKGIGVNRFSAGLGVNFEISRISSLFRIDYDLYNGGEGMIEFASDPESNTSKITAELVIVF